MSYEPLKLEPEVIDFWKKKKIYEKQKALGKNGPKFYWICGPPYTSGKFHVGHFWTYASLKDPVLRYKRMQGFDVWDRGGWDMHGLPTSKKVMARLELKTTADIEDYGLDKFVRECEKFSLETLDVMTEDYIRWGVWFDHKNAYMPVKNDYMEGVWWGIKKAWENGFLYEGLKVMPWCSEAETVAAKHELEYKDVTDESIYLKFKLKNEKEKYFIVWTTTPWTIPFNLAIMANPKLDYVETKAGKETWIVAKELLESVEQATNQKLVTSKTFKGAELEGKEYIPLLENEIPKLKKLNSSQEWTFKVLMSEDYVDTSVGTGLVHTAPGCGPEDQEVGHKYGIAPFNETDSKGIFSSSMGKFKNWIAKKDDKKFTKYFEEIGAIVGKKNFRHEYPFHERTKQPVIFRTTKQWFFAVEKLREKMRDWNKKIVWIPEWAGSKTFDNWLANLRDICITRQTIWGTPVPVWKCSSCENYVVVESLKELKKLSGKSVKNMHRPWIDEIIFRCEKCSRGKMKRIPDVCDVWLDAGSASWISLYYPQKKEYLEKYWPGDFILEGKEHIRGWFNLLFDAAAVSGLGCPFKTCYMHGWINDNLGRKMSKSLGNVIDPYEVVDKYGADAVRYYMMGAANPGVDMNYEHKEVVLKSRNLNILVNVSNFLIDFVKNNKISIPKNPKFGVEEKYILSLAHRTLQEVTKLYDNYLLNEIPGKIESLYLDLSRNYIKMVRNKCSSGTKEEKEAVAYAILETLMKSIKMLSTIAPFVTEKIYQELKKVFKTKEISLQLFRWEKPDEGMINDEIEKSFSTANEVITAVLSIRDRKKIGVRWPLKKMIICTDEKISSSLEQVKNILLTQCNIKELEFLPASPDWARLQIKVNHAELAKKFKQKESSIVGTLIQMSPESVSRKLEKSGKFSLEVDDETYEITSDDVYLVESLPEGIEGASFDEGKVYVETTIEGELFEEGLARELMRRIQDLRKKAKLNKSDAAKVKVFTNKEFTDIIVRRKKEIISATGTEISVFSDGNAKGELSAKFSVRDKEISVELLS